jgi:tripartite-type tricarboxylate transporter receptor subunit TctC
MNAFTLVIAAAVLGARCTLALGMEFPERPLRIIVGFPPGGPADTVARLLAQPLSDALGKPLVVQNAAGAAGSVAGERVARATPDGHTLGLVTEAQMLINPSLYKLDYDPARAFSPISLVATAPYLLVASNGLGVKSVRELVALAQARPGSLMFASPGAGSTPHVVMEMFKAAAAIDIRHVPYKGVGPAVPDLLAGRVGLMFSPIATGLPLVAQSKLQALAVSSARRVSVLPDVVPLAESGYPNFDVTGWLALVAPMSTPEPIVSRLHEEIVRALAAIEMRAKLLNLGLEPMGSSPEALSRITRPGNSKWGKVIKDAGIRLD